MKRLLFYCMLLLLVLMVSGCGSADQSKKDVVAVFVGSPKTIDPRLLSESVGGTVAIQLFEGLVTLDDRDNVQPAGAVSWHVSPDGLEYTFILRTDAKWSNGDHVKASDYERSWKQLLDPNNKQLNANLFYFIEGAENYNKGLGAVDDVAINAVDEYTLRVRLKNPCPFFVSLVGQYNFLPVHKDSDFNVVKKIICNGPFVLEEYEPGKKYTLAANEKYYDHNRVRTERLTIRIDGNDGDNLKMFNAGTVDFVETPPIAALPNLIKKGMVIPKEKLGIYFYDFNINKYPFNDVRVRKALTLALNREEIVARAARAGEKPALSWVPKGFPDAEKNSDFRENGGNLFIDNDINQARQLLADAGFKNGNSWPHVTLQFNKGELHQAVASLIAEQWSTNLNIKVELQPLDSKEFYTNRLSGDYDIARDSRYAFYDDPIAAMYWLTAGNSNSGYDSVAYNNLITAAAHESDKYKRMALLHQAENQIINDMPILPLFFNVNKPMISNKLKGLCFNSLSYYYFKEAYK